MVACTISSKETTELPQKSIHKFRKTKKFKLSEEHVYIQTNERNTQKLGYNKYYEHIPHLMNVLSGTKAPSLLKKQKKH